MRWRAAAVVSVVTALALLPMESVAACRKKPPAKPGKLRAEPITVPTPLLMAHAERRVTPVFPEEARAKRMDGTVQIAVEVNHDGEVTETLPLKGDPLLVASAVDAAKRWRFESFCIQGLPYTVRSVMEFQFRWRGDGTRVTPQ